MDHDQLFKELLRVCFVDFLDLFLPEVVRYLDVNTLEFRGTARAHRSRDDTRLNSLTAVCWNSTSRLFNSTSLIGALI